MTTSPTTRGAFARLTGRRPVAPLGAANRVVLPFPAPVNSREARPTLSIGARLGWTSALEVAGLVAAAMGAVALLELLCR